MRRYKSDESIDGWIHQVSFLFHHDLFFQTKMMEGGMRERILITMLLLHGFVLESLDRARKDMKEGKEETKKGEFDSLGRVEQG